MAKNIGPIKFTGKLGGISGRDTRFGNVLQSVSGVSRDMSDPSLVKIRQLNNEFAPCAKISSVLFRAVDFYVKTTPDFHPYNHIQKRMLAIKKCDVLSSKGERTVGRGLATENGMALLKGFSFNQKKGLSSVLYQGYSLSLSEGTLSIAAFNVSRMSFPKGTDRVGFQLVLIRLDLDVPACTVATSDFFFVPTKSGIIPVELKAPMPEGDGILIGMLFVGFCSVVREEVVWKIDVRNVLEVLDCE